MAEAKKQTRRPRIEWTPEQDAAIIQAYKNRDSLKPLCEMWGVKPHNIHRRADKLGITGRDYFTFKEIEHIKKHFPTLMPVSEIAKAIGRTEKQVIVKAGTLGVKRPTMYKALHITEEKENEIVRLYEEDKLYLRQLAERFEISTKTVRKILVRHGVELRNKNETSVMRNRDRLRIIPFPELYKLYFVDCLPGAQIQKKYGLSRNGFRRNLDHHGIQRRSVAERKAMLEEFKDRERTFKDKVKE